MKLSRLILLGLLGCLAYPMPALPASPSPNGLSRLGHTIQVGAFADVRNAEKLTARLQREGIDAFYFKNERSFYVVRFGDYTSKEGAAATADRLAAKGLFGDYFIAPPAAEAVARRTNTGSKPQPERDPEWGVIAARTAERFIGIPYRWGGNTVVDGLDCSGFVRAVYHLMGIGIPRTAAEQYRVGRPVSRDELRQGDLVFFGTAANKISHVGLYVGNGNFVHAPRRGQDITITALKEYNGERRFLGAKRYY